MLSTAGHSPSQPGSPGETCRRACLRHAADDQKQSSGCSVQATQWRHAPHITHNCRRRYMSRTRLAAGRGRCFNDNVLAGRRARRAFDGPLRPHTPWSPLANRTDRPLAPAFRNCVLHDSMYACARDILQGECDSRAAVSVLCEAGAERTRIRVGRACGRRAQTQHFRAACYGTNFRIWARLTPDFCAPGGTPCWSAASHHCRS